MNLKPPSPLSQTFFYANSEYSVIFLIRGEPHSLANKSLKPSKYSELRSGEWGEGEKKGAPQLSIRP